MDIADDRGLCNIVISIKLGRSEAPKFCNMLDRSKFRLGHGENRVICLFVNGFRILGFAVALRYRVALKQNEKCCFTGW